MMTVVVVSEVVMIFGGGGGDVILRENSGEVRGTGKGREFTMELSNEPPRRVRRVSNVTL